MSNKPISPLRQRMIDDMMARPFSEDTQRDYVRNVRNFAAFLGQSPDTATKEDLRRFQLHMAQQQISPGSINAAIAALRFFFTATLERPDLVRPLRTPAEVLQAIDANRTRRPGTVSRNTWITEAIHEKLLREGVSNDKQPAGPLQRSYRLC
jgi:hypothetical protein